LRNILTSTGSILWGKDNQDCDVVLDQFVGDGDDFTGASSQAAQFSYGEILSRN
jgi:hypothetical protein